MNIYTDPQQAAAFYWYIRNSEYIVQTTANHSDRIPAHTPKLWERIDLRLLALITKLEYIPSGFSTGPWGIPQHKATPIQEVLHLDPAARRQQYAVARRQAYTDLLRCRIPVSYIEWLCSAGELNKFWIRDSDKQPHLDFAQDFLGGHLLNPHSGYITHICFDGQKRRIRELIQPHAQVPHLLTKQSPGETTYRVIQ